MAYNKTIWHNNTKPAINEVNLNKIENQLALDSARIDEIITLPPGSTQGNEELVDIRVGADGTTYTNAGTAVRAQVGAIKEDIDKLPITMGYSKINLFNSGIAIANSKFASNNGAISSSTDFWLSGKTPILDNTHISFNCTVYKIAFFNELTFLSTNTTIGKEYDIPTNATHILAQFRNSDITYDQRSDIFAVGDVTVFENLEIKQLADEIHSKFEPISDVPYYGTRIDFNNYIKTEKIGTDQYSTFVKQGCAIYGTKLFSFYTDGYYSIWDVEERKRITVGKLPINVHCNSVSFTNIFVNDTDNFPLVCVNAYGDEYANGTCFYFHIANDYTSALHSTINIGFIDDPLWIASDTESRPYGNFTVDIESNHLYAWVLRGADAKMRIFMFQLPTETRTLNKSDIITWFDVDYMNLIQDGFIHNGKLYIVHGYKNQSPELCVINLISHQRETVVDLAQVGLNVEPEGIEFYKQSIILTFYGNVYKLDF